MYRFISTGTIEEKIFQRQASKQALSSCVVDDKQDTERHFSGDELRQLFLFKEHTLSETHDTFKCKRCRDGKQVVKAPALLYGDASTWVPVVAQSKTYTDDGQVESLHEPGAKEQPWWFATCRGWAPGHFICFPIHKSLRTFAISRELQPHRHCTLASSSMLVYIIVIHLMRAESLTASCQWN